ncbi:ferric reductase-like transmembrane domain-containing protein [Streptomyces sp. MUM 178J]|uniref:ferric reductase-like transmembrane domain-containing protein n=1 Tax=Streptomyces sp. MUM 178J TaxID=2791991 RepID=UPI001F04B292|nr:ferric reductase-like transmembrane domain-containing protein [Streptomyces sp. MUM 178J]WRQ79396.1 ferric reductase-like transmembrane domain-containing protein [Streptomyces sp. MUM 178J]
MPRPSPESGPGLSRRAQGGVVAGALVLLPLIAVVGGDALRAALDFASGVLSLVSLSASVAWGLIATDRLLLSPRHRLLAQAVHRTTAISSLAFLLLHVTVKVSLGHVALIGALIPFSLGVTSTEALIGFGSLAGLLMVVAGTTGALRSALAGNVRTAGRWRPLHMLAYPAWCFALVHGLYTGRPAAGWVVAMYSLALLGVAAVVSLRLLPAPLKRTIAARITTLTGSADSPAAEEQFRRNLSASPLPGASGLAGMPGPAAGGGRGDRTAGRRDGMSSQGAFGRFEQEIRRESPLEQTRVQAPRIEAPSPQLYEVPPPAEAGPDGAAPGTGPGPGRGIAAAYRAVSLSGDRADHGAPQSDAPGAPLAERVPMTEELPIVSEPGAAKSGLWPTPSPPPPTPASPSSAAQGTASAYGAFGDPGDSVASAAAPGGPASYETPPTPSYDTPYGVTAPYGAAGGSSEAAYGDSPYGSSYAPGGGGHDGPSPFDPSGSPFVASSDSPFNAPLDPDPTPRPSGVFDETAPLPGPLFPPPAGEPWHAPAGERP